MWKAKALEILWHESSTVCYPNSQTFMTLCCPGSVHDRAMLEGVQFIHALPDHYVEHIGM